ncbi:DUF2501 domain-containing protein [Bordetella sp. 2513F-2]
MATIRPRVIVFVTAMLCSTLAQAQLLDSVKGALGGGASAQAGGAAAGPGAVPALNSVGTGNIAGVVEYCAKNNYLGGDAGTVKDKLLGRLGGPSQAQSDSGYREGASGVLGGNSGTKLDFRGGGLKAQLTEKVCDQVLDYAKSSL